MFSIVSAPAPTNTQAPRMSLSSAQLRASLLRTLWIGGILLALLAITGLLWAWLSALGDQSGADAVRGIACVIIALTATDVLTLLVLLTLAILRMLERDANSSS